MTDLRHFLDAFQSALDARRTELAIANGTKSDRALDQYRYAAGQCSGLAEAVTILNDTMKKLTEEDSE
jgi:hypothetical protein